jgi:hypothetical protein
MINDGKKGKPEGGYACAGVLALSLAVLMHFSFGGLSPEQVDELPLVLRGAYRAVGIAGFSFPLGAVGVGLVLREVFKPRRPRSERPRVVVVRRPEKAPAQSAGAGPPDGTAQPEDELEVGEPLEPAYPKIPGRWATVRLNARRGTTTDAGDPTHTPVVESGGGHVELASARYMNRQPGGD